MATITFKYVGKCAASDPHITLAAEVNGTERGRISHLTLSQLCAAPDLDDYESVARVLLFGFLRKWRADNPSGTLQQLRTALEAASWTV